MSGVSEPPPWKTVYGLSLASAFRASLQAPTETGLTAVDSIWMFLLNQRVCLSLSFITYPSSVSTDDKSISRNLGIEFSLKW